MWWRHTPRTDQEHSQEIARLTKKRDHLLDRAPEAVLARQSDCPVFSRIDDLPGRRKDFLSAGALRLLSLSLRWRLFGALLFVFLRGSLNLPSIGDRWGMSRLLGYEGDSPQELQNEIERLRAQMGQADQPKQ